MVHHALPAGWLSVCLSTTMLSEAPSEQRHIRQMTEFAVLSGSLADGLSEEQRDVPCLGYLRFPSPAEEGSKAQG